MEGQARSEGPVGESVDELIGSTTERVQSVLEAAERAAEGIIKDAEAEAERQIAEAQARAERLVRERSRAASQLTDEVLDQAATIREQSEQLIAALQRAIEMVEGDLVAVSEGADEAARGDVAAEPAASDRPLGEARADRDASARRGGLTAVPPTEPAKPAVGPTTPGASSEAGPQDAAKAARLLATQLAVAGASREEIEKRLRNELGIDDPGSILDAARGAPEAGPDRRT
jgi:vacuolar-type H+-ATPase subunit H